MQTEGIVNAKGTIFDIRRTSYNDGSGTRTTIFLKGCNMNCAWCHNPESINKKIELMFDPKKCLCCRLCEKVCDKNTSGISLPIIVTSLVEVPITIVATKAYTAELPETGPIVLSGN